MRHWRTTGNSDVATQTGSTYISESLTDIITISTRGSSQKMSTSDQNIVRQPEIAIWPPKLEIVIPLELQQIASKFQRQVRDFRPWQARVKCRQVITTMTDNCKGQRGPPNRKYLYLWNYDREDDNSNGNLGLSTTPSAKNWPRVIAIRIDNRKWQYRRFGRQSCNFW